MSNDQFSKRFMSISLGISAVLLSGAAFIYSINPSYAAKPVEVPQVYKTSMQMGTNENYIPITITNGYAYWLIFNTTDGYKFRKMAVASPKWEEKQ